MGSCVTKLKLSVWLHNLEYFRSKLSKTPNLVGQYQSPSTALMQKKSFNYNEHNYRDAIGRLKMMLNDSYSPSKYASSSSIFKSVTDDETDTTENTIVERPPMKDVSKYFHYKPYSTFSTASSYARKPSMASQSLQVPSNANNKFTRNCVKNFQFLLQWEVIRLTRCFRLATINHQMSCLTS